MTGHKVNLRVLLIPLGILAFDLVRRIGSISHWRKDALGIYVLAFWLSIFIWQITALILRLLRGKSRPWAVVYVVLVSFSMATLLVGYDTFFSFYGSMPNFFTANYILSEPFHTTIIFRESLTLGLVLFILGLTLILGILLWWSTRPDKPPAISPGKGGWAYSLLAVVNLFVLNNNFRFYDQAGTPDASALIVSVELVARKTVFWSNFVPGLQHRFPPALEPVQAELPFNLLLIVNESLRYDRLSLNGYERPTTPGMEAFSNRFREDFFLFRWAHTNSNSTFLSLGSMLSGLSPALSGACNQLESKPSHRVRLSWRPWRLGGLIMFRFSLCPPCLCG